MMALTDRKGRLMNFIIVEGQCYEGKHVRALLPKWQKWKVVGDKGFDSDKLRKEFRGLEWPQEQLDLSGGVRGWILVARGLSGREN